MNDSERYRKILLFILSFKCSQMFQKCSQNMNAMYSHKHYKMVMSNILTSGGFNKMSFFLPFAFLENTFANQQNAMANFEPFKY